MKANFQKTTLIICSLFWLSTTIFQTFANPAGAANRLSGDSNCDGTVNVMDLITTADYIMGNNPQPFCFDYADVNADGMINIADIIETVNIIMGGGSFTCGTSTVTDVDGKVYNTVLMGGECWLKEDLRVTRYNNGDNIPTGLDDAQWSATTEGAYTIYNNDPQMLEAYGLLYNWYAVVDARGLCPEGWSVPNDSTFYHLIDYLISQGYDQNINSPNGTANAMKSCRQVNSPYGGECNTSTHPRWNSNSVHHGLDAFGFSSLPGGGRGGSGNYGNVGKICYWWGTSESNIMPPPLPMRLAGAIAMTRDGSTGSISIRGRGAASVASRILTFRLFDYFR